MSVNNEMKQRTSPSEATRDDLIDAEIDNLVCDAMASAESLDEALSRYLVLIDGLPVTIPGRDANMTRALLELLDMVRDGAPIEQMRAHERAMRKALADALRNDYGIQARAEEIVDSMAAEAEAEKWS